MPEQVWKVCGYQSGDMTFEKTFPCEEYSERDMVELLRRLVCCNLNEDELLSTYLSDDDPSRASHLDVQPIGGGKAEGLMTNGNPYYTATKETLDSA